jgi:hypothetical protein
LNNSIVAASFYLGRNRSVVCRATDRLWFKGGVGAGQLSVSDSESSSTVRSDTRVAGMLAVGVELFQGRSSALDLQLRGAATSFSDGTITNGSLLIGYSWYQGTVVKKSRFLVRIRCRAMVAEVAQFPGSDVSASDLT